MAKKEAPACRRPYELGRRLEISDQNREGILKAARKQLESNGFFSLTMEALARESGVTRQTIHNLFGTKTGVLEAVFDQLAMDGGMERMGGVMRQNDLDLMLSGFVEVFSNFWAKDRLLIRRIHGLAAINPDLGAVVQARNQRRQHAAARVVDQFDRRRGGGKSAEDRKRRAATLYALTSFEFFDALVESGVDTADTAQLIATLVNKAFESISC